MQKYWNTVQDERGNPRYGASVSVQQNGVNSAIYTDSAGLVPAANPLTTDSTRGYFEFYAAAGTYDLSIFGVGFSPYTITGGAILGLPSGDVTFTQSGTGATPTAVQDELRRLCITPQQFGAVGDDSTNDSAAFALATTAAIAQGKTLAIPAGTYKLASTWAAISTSGQRVIALGKVILHFTGTGNAVTIDGGASSSIYNTIFGGDIPITVKGNASCTNAVYTRANHHSKINVRTLDCIAGLRSEWCVLSEFRHVQSVNEQAFVLTPTYGMYLDKRGAGEQTSFCDIYATEEGITTGAGEGIHLQDTLGNNFYGGASESNTIGVNAAATALDDKFFGMDFESNSSRSLDISGQRTAFYNVRQNSGSIGNVRTGATAVKFIGGLVPAITIDAGAINTYLGGGIQVQTITDSGTGTRYDAVKDNLTNTFKADVVPDGIKLGGGVTALSFYDDLTWTPVMSGDGTAGTPTYSVQSASYQKIGTWIHGRVFVQISNKGGMVGNIQISLPAASSATANSHSGGSLVEMGGLTFPAGYSQAAPLIIPNSSVMYLALNGTGISNSFVKDTDIVNATYFIVEFKYKAAS